MKLTVIQGGKFAGCYPPTQAKVHKFKIIAARVGEQKVAGRQTQVGQILIMHMFQRPE